MVERIGVRALQQHASRVLRTVTEGATVEVTDRGRLVAHLIPASADRLAVLAAAGQARPARLAVGDLGAPLPARRGKRSLSHLLEESREGER